MQMTIYPEEYRGKYCHRHPHWDGSS
uniref:Uncharacterized protein n=1 Tax=Rhizophora mucronata TaxID=61149 RepID=A0A2P2P5R0_RHIMU